ncbi:MAG: metallophosphoesterase family protein [Myxococcota bacterium]|nr:metallophosphoesterase family protein [Myxococcota bacterium]
MKILFIADVHDATAYLAPLIQTERDADLVIIGGDLTNFGGAASARAVVDPLRLAFPQVRAIAGNVDRPEVLDWIESEGISLHLKTESIGQVTLSGVSGSNHTPIRGPTEYAESELRSTLDASTSPPAQGTPWILVTHVPPFDTRTDRMFMGKHVGSTALRDFLKSGGPSLCLCGHIHEAAAIDAIGSVSICNPGSLSSGRYAVITQSGTSFRCELCQLDLSRVRQLAGSAQMLAGKIKGYLRHRLKKGHWHGYRVPWGR